MRSGNAATAAATSRSAEAAALLRSLSTAFAFIWLTCLLAGTAYASAATTHAFNTSFVVGSGPSTVAVDEETGHVYVVAGGQVRRFTASGAPADFPAVGGNSIDGCCAPEPDGNPFNGFVSLGQIAIDNSGGPNQGIIYVPHFNGLDVYSPSGEWLDHIEAVSDPGNSNSFQWEACGVAVDDSGNVFALHEEWLSDAPQKGTAFVDKFSPGKWAADANPRQVPTVRSTLMGIPKGSCRIAVDSDQNVYVRSPDGKVRRYSITLFNLPTTTGTTIGQMPGARNISLDPSSDELYITGINQVQRFNSEGLLQEAIGVGNLTNSNGAAVDPATGVLYASNSSSGGRIFRFDPVSTPDVTGVAATSTQGNATISADVDPAGAGDIIACQIAYGLTSAYGSTTPCSPDPAANPPGSNFAGPTEVSASISGLALETEYHYRFEVSNGSGTTRDLDRKFTTHAVANVQTTEPSEVTQFSAVLNGSFAGNGEPSSYYFEWGPTTAYGNVTSPPPGVSVGAPTDPVEVSAPLEGLAVYQPYHFRLVVTNGAGTTYGADRLFYTSPPFLPEVGAASASALTPTTATLSSTVNPKFGDTVYRFQYGRNASYGNLTPVSDSIGSDDAFHPIADQVGGLLPGTTYHYRVIATNFAGSSQGADHTFTTPDVPGIDRSFASAVTQSTAKLEAEIRPNLSATGYHFEYGESTGYGIQTIGTSSIGSGMASHRVAKDIAGLAPGTTYHFRVVATNLFGSTAGPDQTFSTAKGQASPPAVAPKPRKCKRSQVKRNGKCRKRQRKSPSRARKRQR